MSAPLYEALCALSKKNTIRFHMPGHKGQPVLPDFSPIFFHLWIPAPLPHGG